MVGATPPKMSYFLSNKSACFFLIKYLAVETARRFRLAFRVLASTNNELYSTNNDINIHIIVGVNAQ